MRCLIRNSKLAGLAVIAAILVGFAFGNVYADSGSDGCNKERSDSSCVGIRITRPPGDEPEGKEDRGQGSIHPHPSPNPNPNTNPKPKPPKPKKSRAEICVSTPKTLTFYNVTKEELWSRLVAAMGLGGWQGPPPAGLAQAWAWLGANMEDGVTYTRVTLSFARKWIPEKIYDPREGDPWEKGNCVTDWNTFLRADIPCQFDYATVDWGERDGSPPERLPEDKAKELRQRGFTTIYHSYKHPGSYKVVVTYYYKRGKGGTKPCNPRTKVYPVSVSALDAPVLVCIGSCPLPPSTPGSPGNPGTPGNPNPPPGGGSSQTCRDGVCLTWDPRYPSTVSARPDHQPRFTGDIEPTPFTSRNSGEQVCVEAWETKDRTRRCMPAREGYEYSAKVKAVTVTLLDSRQRASRARRVPDSCPSACTGPATAAGNGRRSLRHSWAIRPGRGRTTPAAWQSAITFPPYSSSTFFLDEHHGWFGTSRYGALWATADGGRSWREAALPPLTGGHRAVLDVHFVTPARGYVASLEPYGARLLATEDGGLNWEVQYPPGR